MAWVHFRNSPHRDLWHLSGDESAVLCGLTIVSPEHIETRETAALPPNVHPCQKCMKVSRIRKRMPAPDKHPVPPTVYGWKPSDSRKATDAQRGYLERHGLIERTEPCSEKRAAELIERHKQELQEAPGKREE